MIEFYKNPADEVPDYGSMNPLALHLAFVLDNLTKDKIRLIEAGATLISDELLKDRSHFVMMRDPWGLSIQLCQRAVPMLVDHD